MDKQEQIEKMYEDIPSFVGDKYRYGACVHHRELLAEALVNAGYINGADFVEWLKKDIEGKHWLGYVQIIKNYLDKALQEYLKGE